jgi:hypothetical protein
VVAGTELATLLRSLDPVLRPGEFVYVPVPSMPAASQVEVLASVVEPEGLSVVMRREDADALSMAYDYVAAWIILRVQSSLAAVGLTAAVSTALAAEGISCNVIAGLHHDHLLVPLDDVDRALAVLRRLVSSQ